MFRQQKFSITLILKSFQVVSAYCFLSCKIWRPGLPTLTYKKKLLFFNEFRKTSINKKKDFEILLCQIFEIVRFIINVRKMYYQGTQQQFKQQRFQELLKNGQFSADILNEIKLCTRLQRLIVCKNFVFVAFI